MPNTKIYVDHRMWAKLGEDIAALLPQVRDLLCRELRVGPAACQIAALSISGLSDQPQINVELHILPAPDRTRDLLVSLGEEIRQLLAKVTTEKTSVRIAMLDPQTYIALR